MRYHAGAMGTRVMPKKHVNMPYFHPLSQNQAIIHSYPFRLWGSVLLFIEWVGLCIVIMLQAQAGLSQMKRYIMEYIISVLALIVSISENHSNVVEV